MKERTVKLVREMRGTLVQIDDATNSIPIFALCAIASAVGGLLAGSHLAPAIGVAYGVGSFVGLIFWVWMMIYARRAWLFARAAFEVASDCVDDEPAQEPAVAAPPVLDPEPPPAVQVPEPIERISSETAFMQMLKDMPSEKLQAILDARALRTSQQKETNP